MPKRAALATHVRLPDHSGSSDENVFAMRILSTPIRGARFAIAMMLALAALASVARAQVPVPPPAPPPLTRPSVPILPGAPSQLTSVPGVVATPLLTPVPIPTALPTPAPATIQLQLLHHHFGHAMVGHCDRVQLYRGTLGCFRRLFQLHNKHAAVTVHPAGTISRARVTPIIRPYRIVQHNVQAHLRAPGCRPAWNVEFTGPTRCKTRRRSPGKPSATSAPATDAARPYSTSSLAGGCEL